MTTSLGVVLVVPFLTASPADARKPVRPTATTAPATTAAPPTTSGSTSTTQPPSTPVPGSAPTSPPARMCGSTLLSGPATQPAGSVRVNPGTKLQDATAAAPAGSTFWLAPGVHVLGSSEYDQVIPKNGNTYVGAPGAVVDGQRVNSYAFGSGWPTQSIDVTIRNLTIQNFAAPLNQGVVNPGAAAGWTVERNTIARNAGHALYIGTNNVVRNNCIDSNGQAGFGTYRASADKVKNIVLDGNEITRNNTDDWESKVPNCGCTGAGKFWEVTGARATNNWVHHNKSVGLWADVNNVDLLFEGNLIEDNDAEGLFYEVSYNVVIRHNTLRRNALVKGRQFQTNTDFPVGAIYISESGGDARIPGVPSVEIHGNVFENNWAGVVMYEGANRFCGSPAHPGSTCTLVNIPVTNSSTCVSGTINAEPYLSECRWKTQNVHVHDNVFTFDPSAVGCTTNLCGRQGLISDWGSYPDWSPYRGNMIKDAITFKQNNRFANNTYNGPWRFSPYDSGRNIDFATWRAAPYNQDAGSTMSTTIPLTANHLDRGSGGFEGSIGVWSPWFSSQLTRSTLRPGAGVASGRVDLTGSSGWGVATDNWPGFAATPGPKTIGLWARLGAGNNLDVTMTVKWRDASGTDLKVDRVAISRLETIWREAAAQVTAPAGTTRVGIEVTSTGGAPGDHLYLDNFRVAPRPI